MMMLDDFKAARKVLDGVLHSTDLIESPFFSKATGNQVYIKPENMQVTGAYKIRGAYFQCSTLTDEETHYRVCRQPCPGGGLCSPSRWGAGHHRHAHHHALGKGEQHQGLRRRGNPPRRDL